MRANKKLPPRKRLPGRPTGDQLTAFIGAKLLSRRTAAGYSQQEVADMIGVDRTTYGKYELGQQRQSIEALVAISDIYEVPVTYFVGQDAPSSWDNWTPEVDALAFAILRGLSLEVQRELFHAVWPRIVALSQTIEDQRRGLGDDSLFGRRRVDEDPAALAQ